MNRFTRALLLLPSMALMPSPAHAQGADPQLAAVSQALFDQALDEMAAGNYPSACKKLEEVTRLAPDALGARLQLAGCLERLGKLASAWSQYALVEQLANQKGQAERAMEAGKRAAELRPKLASVTVQVPPEVRKIPAIEIARDGLTLREAQWGAALPADAGEHEITASAPGYQPWKRPIQGLTDGARITVSVESLLPAPKPKEKPGPITPVPIAPPPPDRSWVRPVGIASTVAGGTSLAAGLIFGALALSTKDRSNRENRCNQYNYCDDEGLELRQQAVKLGDAATGLSLAGLVLGAGGVVLWALAPKEKKNPPKIGAQSPEPFGVLGVAIAPGTTSWRLVW